LIDFAAKRDGASERRELSEARLIQNPALCAWLIWLTGLSYQAENSEVMGVPHAFLVLPLLLHDRTLRAISSTQKASGLAIMAAKLKDRREDLLAIHDRTRALRELTLEALATANTGSLIDIDSRSATVRAFTLLDKPPSVPERLKPFAPAAEKLGAWFARAPLPQVAMLLRVDF
jgi:hypothetical protein